MGQSIVQVSVVSNRAQLCWDLLRDNVEAVSELLNGGRGAVRKGVFDSIQVLSASLLVFALLGLPYSFGQKMSQAKRQRKTCTFCKLYLE